jgi:hypothetical protein
LNNPVVGWDPQSGERVFGSVVMNLRKMWAPPNYGIYFTDRRLIFARVSGYYSPAGGLIVDDIIRAGKKREIEENQAKYAQMSPQQMADGKDNVGVFYEHVLNVTVKEKRFLEMEFVFCRMQKLGWEKVGFNTWGVDFPDEAVRSLSDLLRKFLPTKLNVQLQSSKLRASFGGS